MKNKLSEEIKKIGPEYVAKKTGIPESDLNNKILTNNFNIGDLFRFKHGLNLSNEKVCELFDI
jgi:hypothetical protein